MFVGIGLGVEFVFGGCGNQQVGVGNQCFDVGMYLFDGVVDEYFFVGEYFEWCIYVVFVKFFDIGYGFFFDGNVVENYVVGVFSYGFESVLKFGFIDFCVNFVFVMFG